MMTRRITTSGRININNEELSQGDAIDLFINMGWRVPERYTKRKQPTTSWEKFIYHLRYYNDQYYGDFFYLKLPDSFLQFYLEINETIKAEIMLDENQMKIATKIVTQQEAIKLIEYYYENDEIYLDASYKEAYIS